MALMPILSRRRFLTGAAALAAGAGLARSGGGRPGAALAAPAEPGAGRTVPLRFTAAERPASLPCFSGITLPMWTFSDTTWLPVIRIQLGDRLDALLENRLPRENEHATIHWHGIRLPNDQDGVPFLIQRPVAPGEDYRYGFQPPDTGTFFFHTHCNTAEQLGRGLAGILIVEGDTTEPYAADEIVWLRDWRIDAEARSFSSFLTKKGASKAGTFGNIRSANGESGGEIRLPASADCRLRIINGDPTRVMDIAVDGAEAAVVAIDGVAVSPFPLTTWLLAPAMRVDLVVRSPQEGGLARIVDARPEEPVSLVKLIGTGPTKTKAPFDPKPLRAGRIPDPELAGAERMAFVFASAGQAGAVAAIDPLAPFQGSICLASDEFWTINDTAWPGRDHAKIPPPLARLERGRSYRFTLVNGSKVVHPIHVHGHTFKVLRSDKRSLPVHHADTVLLLPEETIEVAFLADNPGRWMLHCHIIEHQETGMMGYVEVL